MAYRKLQPHKPHRNRTMQDTVTPGRTFVHNGATAYLAVPCWYHELRRPKPVRPHNRLVHDHMGWPDPRRPDRGCQNWDFAECRCSKGHYVEGPHVPYTGHAGCGMHRHCRDYIDLRKFFPVHLTEEGYTKAVVDMENPPAGVKAEAWIDEANDWVVRILFDVAIPNMTEPLRLKYTVRVERGTGNRIHRDIVTIGVLDILPAVYKA